MNKTIIVDVDGVILDYHQAIISAYRGHYIECDNPTDLEDIFSPTIAKGYITLFNQTPQFAELEPYRESEVYLKKLYDDGYVINLVTACGDGLLTQQLRLDNLRNVFGDIFNDIEFVPLGKSKLSYLNKFSNTEFVYVDDNYEHYLDAQTVGLDAVMMQTDFNKDLKTNMMSNWSDLYQYIINKY